MKKVTDKPLLFLYTNFETDGETETGGTTPEQDGSPNPKELEETEQNEQNEQNEQEGKGKHEDPREKDTAEEQALPQDEEASR